LDFRLPNSRNVRANVGTRGALVHRQGPAPALDRADGPVRQRLRDWAPGSKIGGQSDSIGKIELEYISVTIKAQRHEPGK
jgi:hypothetical protein